MTVNTSNDCWVGTSVVEAHIRLHEPTGKYKEAWPAMRACPEALLLAFGVVKT